MIEPREDWEEGVPHGHTVGPGEAERICFDGTDNFFKLNRISFSVKATKSKASKLWIFEKNVTPGFSLSPMSFQGWQVLPKIRIISYHEKRNKYFSKLSIFSKLSSTKYCIVHSKFARLVIIIFYSKIKIVLT